MNGKEVVTVDPGKHLLVGQRVRKRWVIRCPMAPCSCPMIVLPRYPKRSVEKILVLRISKYWLDLLVGIVLEQRKEIAALRALASARTLAAVDEFIEAERRGDGDGL
jgi:hypothetical protein